MPEEGADRSSTTGRMRGMELRGVGRLLGITVMDLNGTGITLKERNIAVYTGAAIQLV